MSDWGPWIEHDGRGRPVPPGTFVRAVSEDVRGVIKEEEGVAGDDPSGGSWNWENFGTFDNGGIINRIIRYRTRRYRAADDLIASIREVEMS